MLPSLLDDGSNATHHLNDMVVDQNIPSRSFEHPAALRNDISPSHPRIALRSGTNRDHIWLKRTRSIWSSTKCLDELRNFPKSKLPVASLKDLAR